MLHCRGCGRAITENELLVTLAQAERFGITFEDCGRLRWYCDACFSALIHTVAPSLYDKKKASVWAETT